MPGQAIVTIGEKQWQAYLATTYQELVQGLGGLPSILAGTGMLFALPADEAVSVTTESMRFSIDIIFISSSLKVVDVASNVAPGLIVSEATPVRYFLEVNAGEAADVEAGDSVILAIYQVPTFDPSQIVGFAIPLVALGFVCGMAGGMARAMAGKPERRLLPKTNKGRPTRDDVRVEVWEERDRLHIGIQDRETGEYIASWWDDEAREMFEQGFFKRGRGLEESVLSYAEGVGLLAPARPPQTRPKIHFVGSCKVSEGRCLTHSSPVSETVRCPQSPLADEEWRVAYELVKEAFPGGQSNPWVNGWWPETWEEAERAIRHYDESLWKAFWKYEARSREAVELYRRSAEKATYNYRYYVMKEYEKGRERARVPVEAVPRLIGPTERGEAQIRPYRVEENVGYRGERLGTWAVVELWPGGTVRSPFRTKEEAIRREQEIADYYGWKVELVEGSSPKLIGPRERREVPEEIKYFADSRDDIERSINHNGLRHKLDETFSKAIERVKGRGRL